MKKIINLAFICNILILILSIILFIQGIFIENVLYYTICGILGLIVGIVCFKFYYPKFLVSNKKSERWFRKHSTEELEIIEDAKQLIKSVDNKIILSDFKVYNVRYLMHGWFNYDKQSNELSIFIPFKFAKKLGGNDLCFLFTLHEVLHSQNLKDNIMIFDKEFLEGLNQLLTIWLIESYSKKYKISKNKDFSIRIFKDLYLDITYKSWADMIYPDEIKIAEEVIKDANIDIKEVFLKYIDFDPDFFKSFVPSEYLKINN